MTRYYGYAGKILRVDLSSGKVEKEPLDEAMARKWLGGRGFNSRVQYYELRAGIDPLGPENKLMFGVGPLNGTNQPVGDRFNVSAKSPHTGILGDSNSGGQFGTALKYAGYDQLIISGQSEEPVYIFIDDERVEVRGARHLWGKDVWETQEAIQHEIGDSSVHVAAIGPAGENGVTFASVIANLARAAARTGMGAVMGAKKLKAVAVRGTGWVEVKDPDRFRELTRVFRQRIYQSPDFRSRALMGTPRNVIPLNEGGFLVTRHFQTGVFEHAYEISGERLAEEYNIKPKACFACPIHCSRYFVIPPGHRFAGEHAEGPEYETIGGFGSRCGCGDLDVILHANNLANRYGLDTITCSEMISWLMELNQRGIISSRDVDGLDLSWGNTETILALIEKITRREGCGEWLSRGVRWAAQYLGRGSEKYALHVKGLEIIQGEPRGMKGYGLGYAVATRGGDHLRAEPFFELSGDTERAREWFGIPEVALRLEEKGKGKLVKYFGDWCAVCDSLNVCRNTMVCMLVMLFEDVAAMLRATVGWDIDAAEVQAMGERIVNLEHAFNVREGIRRRDDVLPARFTDEPLPPDSGPSAGQRVQLQPMLEEYYLERQWDPATAIPTREKLVALGLADVDQDLEQYRQV